MGLRLRLGQPSASAATSADVAPISIQQAARKLPIGKVRSARSQVQRGADQRVYRSGLAPAVSGHPVQDLDDRAELRLEIGNHVVLYG